MATKRKFAIEGMHCENCVAHVKKAVEGVEGVHAARVDLETANAIVKLDREVEDELIVRAVETAGFTAHPL